MGVAHVCIHTQTHTRMYVCKYVTILNKKRQFERGVAQRELREEKVGGKEYNPVSIKITFKQIEL